MSSGGGGGSGGFFNQPFSVQWRKALVSAPRLVPNMILHYTSSDGPHPFEVKVPSRGRHTIPLSVFVPERPAKQRLDEEAERVPVMVDFHGGGFVMGSCQEQAPWCALVARSLGALVLSVDYRMGPSSQFPAAVHDAEDVLSAILDPSSRGYASLREQLTLVPVQNSKPPVSIDPRYIAISGFSSGANLALNLALSIPAQHPSTFSPDSWPSVIPQTFESEIPLLLSYPSLDCRQFPSERPVPQGMPEKSWWIKNMKIESELHHTYLPRDQTSHPRASPGLAGLREGLHPKARMWLLLPQWDTLAHQSEAWLEKVRSEGRDGDLLVRRVPGVMHGWTQFPDGWLSGEDIEKKYKVFQEARELIRDCWAKDGYVPRNPASQA